MQDAILHFWFQELAPAQWWKVDHALDELIRSRFAAIHQVANVGELYGWRAQPPGRLAEIIVLDQFSRNIYRGTPRAFASDSMALVLAQEAVALGVHAALSGPERAFLLMPYMHSESPLIHVQAERLFSVPGLEDNHRSALKHKAIIDRFGRYPHRNAILGRVSTAEETAFLAQPGSSF
jgi:uncharacterized protein (DUF924 family)